MTESSLSRRSFLTGAAALGSLAAAGALAGCSPKTPAEAPTEGAATEEDTASASGAPDWLAALSAFMPVTYGVDALRAVMLRGADLAAVGFDLAVLWGFLALFFALAAASFRKKRVRTTC